MGTEITARVNKAWLDSVVRYPSYLGKLAGIFYNLLEESNLPPDRKEYYLRLAKELDNK